MLWTDGLPNPVGPISLFAARAPISSGTKSKVSGRRSDRANFSTGFSITSWEAWRARREGKHMSAEIGLEV
jgi:hypothetical protein